MAPNPPGTVTVGTTTAEDIKVAGKVWHNDGEVTAVDPGRRFEWRTTSGAAAHGARSVESVGAGRCRVRIELEVTPTGPNRLLAPLLRRILRSNMTRDGERLRALVQAAVAA